MLGRSLEGIRVVELCNYVAGPLVGLVLADFGADVIKLERLEGGDDGRLLPPFLDGEGYFFAECNRNKRSVALDVTREEGRQVALRLIAKADVVLDNFRSGVMERLGLDFETVRKDNPRLVGCSVTGFGPGNAYSDRPGYDPILQGMSGLMMVTGFDGDPPVRVGPSIVDKTAAIWAACGVIAALFEREQTGEGKQVNVSLLGSAVHIMTQDILRYKATGSEPKRMGGAGGGGGPSGSYQTADGEWIQIAVGNDRIFQRFCAAVGRPELAEDPRFAVMADRIKNAVEMGDVVTEIFLAGTRADWLRRLGEKGVPSGPINTVGDFVADPEVSRQFFWDAMRTTGNLIPQVWTPLSVASEIPPRYPPPRFGEHTDEVLSREVGLEHAEISTLRKSGVIA